MYKRVSTCLGGLFVCGEMIEESDERWLEKGPSHYCDYEEYLPHGVYQDWSLNIFIRLR